MIRGSKQQPDPNEDLIAEVLAYVEQSGEPLTRRGLVDYAGTRPPTSKLNQHFIWDNVVAGDAFRLIQAGDLIRTISVVITIEQVNITVPRYTHAPDLPNGEEGYRSVVGLRTDPTGSAAVLDTEYKRIAGNVARSRALALAFDQGEQFDARLAALLCPQAQSIAVG